MKPCEQIG